MKKTIYLKIPAIKNYQLQFVFYKQGLYGISYIDSSEIKNNETFALIGQEGKIVQQVIAYFEKYFLTSEFERGEEREFKWDVKLKWPKVTDFQLKVLNYLKTIPLGSTQSYGEVANALNTSARAVGNVCRMNPFPIIIPCHRVVAKTGLGGYDGEKINNQGVITGRMAIKYFLLQHEGALTTSTNMSIINA